jgi:CDP-diacylglycerol---glycerol-3-phosphate 3-phosphatidyltransferase
MRAQSIGTPFRRLLDKFVDLLASTSIPPGLITTASVVLYLWAAILFALGRFFAAGATIAIAGLCDLLDGPIARRQGRWTLFLVFLDSILDRYADLILFVGLMIFYARVNRFLDAGLVGAAMAGSVMVSYAQARAESLIERCTVGFWKRPQRVLVMIAGALFNRIPYALVILAIGTNYTVIHRILYTRKHTSATLRPLHEIRGATAADPAAGNAAPRRA